MTDPKKEPKTTTKAGVLAQANEAAKNRVAEIKAKAAPKKAIVAVPAKPTKKARREALKFQTGVKYHFSNADTWFIGEFESFNPDVVTRLDGTNVQEFDARNFIIRDAEKADLPMAAPKPRPEAKVGKFEDGERYFFTTKGGEEFIGTIVDGCVYRNSLRGGVQVEDALFEKPSEFKIREATGAELRLLRVSAETGMV